MTATALVPLEPPYSRSGADPAHYRGAVPLERGPVLARTRQATRWHRVRAGVRHTAENRMAAFHGMQEWTSLWYWCGSGYATINSGRPDREAIVADGLPPEEPLCGTCEGRAIGAGYPPVAVAAVEGARLRFDPASRYRIPPVCPAAGPRGMSAPPGSGRTFPCPACSELVRVRSHGYRESIEQHEPGDGLVRPCPFHRWDSLVVGPDGVARCRCRGGPETDGLLS